MGELIGVLVAAVVVTTAVMAATYIVGERLGRHNVVDVAWGIAFACTALSSAFLGTGDLRRRWVLAALVCVWGVRLAFHLAVRSNGAGEDPRYEALLAKSHRSRRVAVVTRIYALQGALVWFISLPVQVSATTTDRWTSWAFAGVALWIVGFACESLGDAQLLHFKRDPRNRGKVMDRGLWRYTRHPNYFGDACVWWGLYLVAASGGLASAATVASPIVMTVLLVRVSGKGLLERHLAARPGYAEYIERTSGFLPWLPKNTPIRKTGRRE